MRHSSETMNEITWRTILLTVILPIFVPMSMILAGIWYAATWTATQNSKLQRLQDQVTALEIREKGGAAHETRIGQIEFRLNWMDNEKNEYNKDRRQTDREIRDTLERLKDAINKLEAATTNRRRSDFYGRLHRSLTSACLHSLSLSCAIVTEIFADQAEGTRDKEEYKQIGSQVGQE